MERNREFLAVAAMAIALWLAAATNSFAQSATAPQPAAPPRLPAPGGALGELDKLFLDAYTQTSQAIKAQHTPIIVVGGSNLTLLGTSAPTKPIPVIPASFHALKAVAHFPFATYLTLKTQLDAPLSQETIDRLTLFVNGQSAARAQLASFVDGEKLQRQTAILDATTALIEDAIAKRQMSRVRLREFARRMGPLLMENTRDAGCAQVVATHAQVQKWRAELTDVDWSRVVVANRGNHQARYRNAATLYFAWLLGDDAPRWSYPGESDRVVYVETLFGNDEASDLLATVVIDAEASEAFFGDKWRLSEDVLSDGAAQCIGRLPDRERIAR